MKVLVCGSRSLDNRATHQAIHTRLAGLPEGSQVISGGAAGPDTFAMKAALDLRLDFRSFLPNWERDGKRAGILRNLRMLDEQPDLVLAAWDGESHGTKHTIEEARRRGIPVEMIQ